MAKSTKDIGQQGEALALNYLKKHGYTILVTNWCCQQGEIDIVARMDDELAFLEVRARHAATTEAAFGSITPKKRQHMVNTAHAYLHAHDLPEETHWRIDVIAIALRRGGTPLLDHVENALDW